MIQVTEIGGVHVVQMDHGRVNAMDIEFCDALIQTLEGYRDASGCSAVVLTGNGRVFSAGIDLKRFLREGPEYVEPFMIRLEDLFQRVFCFPKPLVSEIHGPAIAGGCMVATAADVRVIVPNAQIGIVESRLGVPLPMTAIEIVRHVATPTAFRKIVTVGATYTGQEAVDQGLADHCATDSRQAAVVAARELTEIPSSTFEITKQQRTGPIMRMVDANRRELMARYLKIWNSDETRAAIQTYVDERLK